MTAVTENAEAKQLKRDTSTRDRLLRAAEALFADQGIAKTSTRAILQAAEQRNESALQYHFGGRDGLIEALYEERGEQVGQERAGMLEDFDAEPLARRRGPDAIRRLCEVAFLPAVRVAQKDPTFVHFLKLVGQLAFLPSAALQRSQTRYEGETLVAVSRRLEPLLDLKDPIASQRTELISRMAAVALTQRARANEPFDGTDAELFFANLVDAMTGVLEAPVSKATKRYLRALPRGGR